MIEGIIWEKSDTLIWKFFNHGCGYAARFFSNLQSIVRCKNKIVYWPSLDDGIQRWRWPAILQVQFKMNVSSVDAHVCQLVYYRFCRLSAVWVSVPRVFENLVILKELYG